MVTTVLWTAQHQQRAYISLTVHFVDSDYKFQSKCLQTLEIVQDHTAELLKEVLTDIFLSWKIRQSLWSSNRQCKQHSQYL